MADRTSRNPSPQPRPTASRSSGKPAAKRSSTSGARSAAKGSRSTSAAGGTAAKRGGTTPPRARAATTARARAPRATAPTSLPATAVAAPSEILRPDFAEHGGTLVPLHEPRPEPRPEPRMGDVDEWGRSEHMREVARKLYDPIYRKWFRVEWEGLEKIPTHGGALLVANHAGAIPSDAPVIMHGIETELHRPVYGLADYFFRKAPVVGTMWSRVGGVAAHPDNAYRLLHDQEQLVLVFPEGTKGPSKKYTERYQLRRFGRGGFVEIAMRAGVPVIPIAVVGAEESMPIVARLPTVARAFGLPYLPVTANMLALGPLGIAGYFPAKFKLKVLDPVHFDVAPGQERYSKSRIMDESEAIRDRIQQALFEMLAQRQSVWFG